MEVVRADLVLRTVANAVAPYGSGQRTSGATVELAIHLFKVTDIVLCGHTYCGGLRALDGPISLSEDPDLALWLEYVRPAQTRVHSLMPGADPLSSAGYRRGKRPAAAEHLRTYPAVRDAVKAGMCGCMVGCMTWRRGA